MIKTLWLKIRGCSLHGSSLQHIRHFLDCCDKRQENIANLVLLIISKCVNYWCDKQEYLLSFTFRLLIFFFFFFGFYSALLLKGVFCEWTAFFFACLLCPSCDSPCTLSCTHFQNFCIFLSLEKYHKHKHLIFQWHKICHTIQMQFPKIYFCPLCNSKSQK